MGLCYTPYSGLGIPSRANSITMVIEFDWQWTKRYWAWRGSWLQLDSQTCAVINNVESMEIAIADGGEPQQHFKGCEKEACGR